MWASAADKSKLQTENCFSASVNEHFSNSAPQSEGVSPLSRFPELLSGVLDSLSYFFFCLSFSNLSHMCTAWCSQFLSEE
jgi:hypothetical protein